jgi:hypothetical protein
MARTPGKRTVTVIREPKVDRLDDPAQGPAAEHDIEGCAVLPRSSNEEGKGWVIIEGRMVVAPFNADVLATDRVRVDGVVWDVDGAPGDYEDRRARGKATIFYLKRQGS